MQSPGPAIPRAPSKRFIMSYTRQDVIVSRDCPAVSVPYGSPVTIEKGCEATITQQLGGSYTVMVEGNLYRVEGKDADALGFEPSEDTGIKPEQGPVTASWVEEASWQVLSTVYDPEIPVDIVNLGLVYACDVIPLGEETFRIEVKM